MKITDIAQAPSVQKTGPAQSSAGQSVVADKVQAEQANDVAESVQTAKASAVPARTVKLQQLQQLVRSGGYQPDPQRIADQILNAAQIDAALRTMIH